MVQILPDRVIYNDGTEHTGSEIDQVYSSPTTGVEYIDSTPAGLFLSRRVKIYGGGLWIPSKTYSIASRYDTIFQADVFTTSGSWVVPAALTEVYVLVAGGGAGGGAAASSTAADGTVTNSNNDIGGPGGLSFGLLSVTPGDSITVTVGAGGTGSDTVLTGGAGGTSSFSTLSATGGSGIATGTGAAGIGSGGTFNGNVSTTLWNTIFSETGFGLPIYNEIYAADVTTLTPQSYTVNVNGVVTPLAWTSGSVFRPGCGGRGETPGSGSSNASGGVQGAVVLFY